MTKFHDWKGRLYYLTSHSKFIKSPILTVIRILVWRVHCLLGITTVIDLPRWGARFFLPPWWGGEGTTMIFALREDYEIELKHLEHFVSPGDVVVDAGANCGIYTIAAAKLVGSKGRVLAFEPGERHASVLNHNISLNHLNNVCLYRQALSDKVGHARLYHHRGPVSYSMAAGECNGDQFDEITTTTLDTITKQENLDCVDFLKMDIEGAEELALRGGKTLLSMSHPVIAFEINPSASDRFGLNRSGTWKHLQGLSYNFFVLNDTGILNPINASQSMGSWEFKNIIAIHKDELHRFSQLFDAI